MQDNDTLVFVYGTLKSGFPNHRVLRGSRFVDDGYTRNRFFFANLGRFPAILQDENCTEFKNLRKVVVHGEIYSVNDSTLKDLDSLEGYPDLYTRKIIPITTYKGTLNCWTYFLNVPLSVEKFINISNGEW